MEHNLHTMAAAYDRTISDKPANWPTSAPEVDALREKAQRILVGAAGVAAIDKAELEWQGEMNYLYREMDMMEVLASTLRNENPEKLKLEAIQFQVFKLKEMWEQIPHHVFLDPVLGTAILWLGAKKARTSSALHDAAKWVLQMQTVAGELVLEIERTIKRLDEYREKHGFPPSTVKFVDEVNYFDVDLLRVEVEEDMEEDAAVAPITKALEDTRLVFTEISVPARGLTSNPEPVVDVKREARLQEIMGAYHEILRHGKKQDRGVHMYSTPVLFARLSSLCVAFERDYKERVPRSILKPENMKLMHTPTLS